MEPVHTLGGHPIYEAMSEEDALKITRKWKAEGKWGEKPRFRFKLDNPTKDTGLYRFQEIEKDAARKLGFRFKPVDTLASTNATRRGLIKKAGITNKEIFNIYQKNFPEAPKKEINQLVRFFREQDKFKNKELQLQRIELERLYGKPFAIDHAEAIASGEKYTDVFTNKRNIEQQINAFKSSKKGSKAYRAFLKAQGIDTADNRILRGLYSIIDTDKPGSMEWNKSMAKYFKPDSPTRKALNKTLKGVGAGGTLLLKTAAEAVADPLTTYTGTVEALNKLKSLPERAVGAIKATEGITGMAGWFSPAIRPVSIQLGAAVSYAELSDTTGLKEKAGDKFQRDVVTGTSTFGYGRNPFEGIFNKDSNTYNKYNE